MNMFPRLKHLANSAARTLGVKPVMLDSYHDLVRKSISQRACIELLAHSLRHPAHDPLVQEFVTFCADHYESSYSQFRQDLFVQWVNRGRRAGFFVDIGGADGITNSNTAGLERYLDWTGLVFEPTPQFKIARQARPRSRVINAAILPAGFTGSHTTMTACGQYSSIDGFQDRDVHAQERRNGSRIKVSGMSFSVAMRTYSPGQKKIDYLSIDTEGSELAILESIDFAEFEIRCLTVEHNHRADDLQRIRHLLGGLG